MKRNFDTVQVAARSPDLRPGDPDFEKVRRELEELEADAAERRMRVERIRTTATFAAKAAGAAYGAATGATDAIAGASIEAAVAPADEAWNAKADAIERTVREEMQKMRSQVAGDVNAVFGLFQSAERARRQQRSIRKMAMFGAACLFGAYFLNPVFKAGVRFVAPVATGVVDGARATATWLDDRVEDLTGATSLDRRLVAQAEKWIGQNWTRHSRDAWVAKIFRELGIDIKTLGDLESPPEGYVAEPVAVSQIGYGDVVWFDGAVGFVGRKSHLIAVADGEVAEIPLGDLGNPVLAISISEKDPPKSQVPTEPQKQTQKWIDPLENMRQWPFTSGYGPRIHPVTGERGKQHNGIDIAAPTGTPLLAVADGTVAWVSPPSSTRPCGGGMGIDHAGGIQTIYCHMSRVDVSAGQKVTQGQTVGAVGNTGRSTGPHLHVGFKEHGNWVNPSSVNPEWSRW